MCAHGKLCCLSCIAAASPCRLLLVPFCCPRQPLLHCSGSAVSSPSTMSSQNPPLRRSFPAESFPPALLSPLSPHQPPAPAYFGGPIKQIPPSPSPAPLYCSESVSLSFAPASTHHAADPCTVEPKRARVADEHKVRGAGRNDGRAASA